jgi:hypothetical protein
VTVQIEPEGYGSRQAIHWRLPEADTHGH